MTPSANDMSKWADHLFNDWKYRHENFWKTLYRFLTAIAILVTIPFVKSEYVGPITKGLGMWIYLLLPFIIFTVLCILLTREHARLRRVEEQLARVRIKDGVAPDAPHPCEELRRRPKTSFFFIFIGLGLLVIWSVMFYIHTHHNIPPCPNPL